MCSTPDTSTIPGLFQRLIRRDFPESTKRAHLIVSTSALVIVALGIGGSIIFRISVAGDVGSGAVGAFLGATGPLAILAGASYRKSEEKP